VYNTFREVPYVYMRQRAECCSCTTRLRIACCGGWVFERAKDRFELPVCKPQLCCEVTQRPAVMDHEGLDRLE
jgi:hypothetical protein